ncbi:hypothetical protein PIB30_045721, partial [Stylosanthes scabra]|nr:hypothetical protein [Stylosanthes scabra]
GIYIQMDSNNMDMVAQDVVAQEQVQETPVEASATASAVPDESASVENSNKSSLKSVY